MDGDHIGLKQYGKKYSVVLDEYWKKIEAEEAAFLADIGWPTEAVKVRLLSVPYQFLEETLPIHSYLLAPPTRDWTLVEVRA